MKHDAWDPDGPSEDEVRALLRSLRVEDPLPPEVATRLDARLAELNASPPPQVAVDELDARRRRGARRPVRVLLATAAGVAAAVGVGGIGLSVTGGDPDVAGGEAASSQSAPAAIPSDAQDASDAPSASSAAPDVEALTAADLPRLTRSGFADEVGALILPIGDPLADTGALADNVRPESAPGDLVEDGPRGAVAQSTDPRSAVRRFTGGSTPCDAGVSPSARQTSFVAVLDGAPVLVLVGPRSAAAYACLGPADDTGSDTGSLLDPDIRPVIRRPLG